MMRMAVQASESPALLAAGVAIGCVVVVVVIVLVVGTMVVGARGRLAHG
jgi:hypothetical protein